MITEMEDSKGENVTLTSAPILDVKVWRKLTELKHCDKQTKVGFGSNNK